MDMSQGMIDDITCRFAYHPPSTPEIAKDHERVRSQLLDVTLEVSASLPVSREHALFVTRMEEAMFWANAAIARYQPEHETV